MTTPWFEDQNESYQDEAYDAFSSKVLYRCIDAELKWDTQVDLTACYELLNEFEHTVSVLCVEHKEPHERLD